MSEPLGVWCLTENARKIKVEQMPYQIYWGEVCVAQAYSKQVAELITWALLVKGIGGGPK